MFMHPVMAAEGVYMPTIEQVLNFYMGEFTDDGRPKDMKAFEEAIETARKAEAAGLFPEEGKPIDNYLYASKEGVITPPTPVAVPVTASVVPEGILMVSPDCPSVIVPVPVLFNIVSTFNVLMLLP